MSDRPKRGASEGPNPRSPVRQKTSTSEGPPSPDVPDGLPEHGLTITLGRPDGRRTTYHIIAERPAPNTVVPEFIISLPETRSPTPGDVPEAEEQSQEGEKESKGPPSSTPPETPGIKMESPRDGDKSPKVKDKLPKVEEESPKEKEKESSPEMMDES